MIEGQPGDREKPGGQQAAFQDAGLGFRATLPAAA